MTTRRRSGSRSATTSWRAASPRATWSPRPCPAFWDGAAAGRPDGPGQGRAAGRASRAALEAIRARAGRVAPGPGGFAACPSCAGSGAARTARAPAMATSLDVGTEYVKALVFRIDGRVQGTVTGAGRTRQGLGHMQAATVTDIGGVVENCRSALRDAEASAGIRPDAGHHRHRGRAGEGVHDQPQPGARSARTRPSREPSWTSSSRASSGRRCSRRSGPSRGRRVCPSVDVRLVHAAVIGCGHRRLPGDQPGGLQGPPRAHQRVQRVRAPHPPGRAPDRGRGASTGSCWPSSRSRTPSRAASAPEDLGAAGALFVDVGRRHHRCRARAPGRRRGHAHVRARRTRLHQVARGPAGGLVRGRRALKIAYATGQDVERPEQVAAIIAEDVAVWAAGMELVLEEFGKHGQLPARIELCGGGSRLPQLAGALRDPDVRERPAVRAAAQHRSHRAEPGARPSRTAPASSSTSRT